MGSESRRRRRRWREVFQSERFMEGISWKTGYDWQSGIPGRKRWWVRIAVVWFGRIVVVQLWQPRLFRVDYGKLRTERGEDARS